MFLGHVRWLEGDRAAIAALLLIILAAVGFRCVYDNSLVEWDILDFFLPNYGYVGDRLRSLEIPAWNPYFSSGTPMAGDAGGGWMYLPAMFAFSLFSAAVAIKVMVLLQSLIGGAASYLLGRRLGLLPLAALFAATAFVIGPALYDATGESTVMGQLSTFIPVGLLGLECAFQAPRWSARLAWCGLAAVAAVQLFASFPQGFMYGAMLMAGWFVYRGLFAPLPETVVRGVHVRRMLILGLITAALAAGFGAAAVLPRLDFSAQSTIAGGDYSNVLGGEYAAAPLSWLELLSLFLQDSVFWRIVEHNSAVLLLGLLAIVLGPTRYGVPFFAVSTGVLLDLATTHSVVRGVLRFVPMFEAIHSHRPTATMYVVFLPLAMLAGAGVQLLLTRQPVRYALVRKLLPLAVVLLAMLAVHSTASVGWWQPSLAVAATVLILLTSSRLPALGGCVQAPVPQIATCGLLLLVLVYPTGRDVVQTVRHPEDLPQVSSLLGDDDSIFVHLLRHPEDAPQLGKVLEMESYLGKDDFIQKGIQTALARRDPGTAAALLQDLQASQPPFRYAAYFGTGGPVSPNLFSTAFRLEPSVQATLAGARAPRLGLEQISGYNPLHLKYYAQYIAAMNGVRQNYHWLDVYASALVEPQLISMLNVRYVLVPTPVAQTAPIASYGRQVYRDDLVVVYENPNAFPRAWLVHDVRSDPDGAGFALLSAGAVDGHAVAFVNGSIPATLAAAPAPAPTSVAEERVVVTSNRPEMITIQSTSVADGLLVVSEPFADGWTASVDGRQVAVVRTDRALQGVPLTAGEHTVVLRYAPRALTLGLWLTGAASLVLASLWFWAVRTGMKRGERTASATMRRASGTLSLLAMLKKAYTKPRLRRLGLLRLLTRFSF